MQIFVIKHVCNWIIHKYYRLSEVDWIDWANVNGHTNENLNCRECEFPMTIENIFLFLFAQSVFGVPYLQTHPIPIDLCTNKLGTIIALTHTHTDTLTPHLPPLHYSYWLLELASCQQCNYFFSMLSLNLCDKII